MEELKQKLADDFTNKQKIRILFGETQEEVLDDITKRKFCFIKGFEAAQKELYTEQDMIDFVDWVDLNDLAFVGWKKWKCTTTVSDIECSTTEELLKLWKDENK